ncbi:YhdH/YhfP family quinone oxidoreductase [Flectobacillus roseus]|uniref:YhdH/YhfP family quinone oxidoreductase n=1 Tax=Flectobacillus roseus TaxID=502259 RepID=UPI0024B864CC|nr:YhdH/YhfP family quinone oxidoreductase [Flectobacillus roseus]MDI9869939.1 YhdH/YhfP family quinone oxidoreductase [Flectobacillus roseus]
MSQFKALVVSENAEKQYVRTITQRNIEDLPAGEVLIKVHYSTLNYKDALSSIGNKGVTRNYPHTPGIDASGVVVESTDANFSVGQEVLVTSYDLGMNTSGALAEYIRVPAKWVIALPAGLSLSDAMILGTAGLTAGLCIDALLKYGVSPEKGKIIVTGSTGGVGILSVAILAKLGFEVVAVTGKPEAAELLQRLGATEIVGRESLNDTSGRPMLKSIYAGAVDTVGGNILATILKSLHYGGAVAACGLVASPDLPTSVFPFILRGNALLGIDSAECPMSKRLEIWQHLASDWKLDNLDLISHKIGLEEVPAKLDLMLEGKSFGKSLVEIID